MTSALFVAVQAHASLISSLDTGAGLYNANTGAAVVDPNWTVSLLSTEPPGQTPPGGIPSGPAYLVPNNIGFPFGYWLDNDSTSSWITYSHPPQMDGDNSGSTFQYQLTFTAGSSGAATVRWLSDNDSWLYISGGNYNNFLVGSKPGPDFSTFGSWNTPISLSLSAGTRYTVDLDVFNEPQGYGNPTGGRVEFSGDVSVVPEPTTLIAGALLLLPFGASTLRILRKQRMA